MRARISLVVLVLLSLGSSAADARGRAPKKTYVDENGKQTLIDISKETTGVTGPLTKLGFPDYVAALNAKLGLGELPPEKNAAVLLLSIFGAQIAGLPPEHLQRQCDVLKIPVPPAGEPYLVDYQHFLGEHIVAGDDDPGGARRLARLNELLEQFPPSQAFTREQSPELAGWLESPECVRALKLIDEMVQREKFALPYVIDDEGEDDDGMSASLVSIILPYVNHSRSLSRLLMSQAMLALGEGRYADAQRRLMQIHRLARLLDQQLTLIEQLVAISIDGTAVSGDVELLQHPNVPLDVLVDYQAALQQLRPVGVMARAVDIAERWMFLNSICMLAQSRVTRSEEILRSFGIATGDETGSQLIRALITMEMNYNKALLVGNEYYDRLMRLGELDAANQRMKLTEFEDQLQQQREDLVSMENLATYLLLGPEKRGEIIAQVVAVMLLPAIRNSYEAQTRAREKQDLVVITAALARFQRKHGKYPASLDAITPEFLEQIPKDQFTGEPLKYVLKDGHYRLYSVGFTPEKAENKDWPLMFTSPDYPWPQEAEN